MNRQKIFSIAGAAMAAALVSSTGAYAETLQGYSPVYGTSCRFDKYLVMKSDAEVPQLTCFFTIAPGKAVKPAKGSPEILAPDGTSVDGIPNTKGTPVITGNGKGASAVFMPGDPTAAEKNAGKGKTIGFATEDKSDEKFASKELTVDFSGVSFSEPGVFRWIISETDPKKQGITPDPQQRTLDVYVTDQEGVLKVSSYVLHKGDAVAKEDDKSSGFTNLYSTHDLTFRKEVTGNQGSKDKYFKVHVAVGKEEGATAGASDRFLVDLSGAETAPSGNAATVYAADVMKKANSADSPDEKTAGEFLTGAQLTAGYDFYLKDGQEISIRGLPDNAFYTLTEDAEDYQRKDGISQDDSGSGKAYADKISGYLKTDIQTGFTNNRQGIIPTGIMMALFPFALLTAVGTGGLAAFILKLRRLSGHSQKGDGQ